MIPPVKIIERGKVDEKAYSVILRNLRGSPLVRADNMLVYGSMKQIEKRIIGLLKEYGKETVMAALDELIDRAREAVKKVISKWPAGTYYAERAADWDGTTDRPVWVRLALTVKPDKGKLIFDFSESDPQADFINVPLGQAWSAVRPSAAGETSSTAIPRCRKNHCETSATSGPKVAALPAKPIITACTTRSCQ